MWRKVSFAFFVIVAIAVTLFAVSIAVQRWQAHALIGGDLVVAIIAVVFVSMVLHLL